MSGNVSWLRIRAIARRHAFVLQRNPQRWFDVVVWPVVDSILFGAIGVYFGRQHGAQAAGAAFLLAGIVLFHVVFQAEISLATGFMEETWSRNLLNLMVTPLREGEYVAGIVLFGFAKVVMAVGTVAVVALALFAFDLTTLGFAIVPMVALLLVIGWAVGLAVIGLILRVGQGAEILAWGVIALLLPLSGIFYPVSALPGALQPLAQALPTTHIFAASRAVVEGHPLPWGELGWAALGTIVLCVFAVWFVLRMLEVFRRRGFISRHV